MFSISEVNYYFLIKNLGRDCRLGQDARVRPPGGHLQAGRTLPLPRGPRARGKETQPTHGRFSHRHQVFKITFKLISEFCLGLKSLLCT